MLKSYSESHAEDRVDVGGVPVFVHVIKQENFQCAVASDHLPVATAKENAADVFSLIGTGEVIVDTQVEYFMFRMEEQFFEKEIPEKRSASINMIAVNQVAVIEFIIDVFHADSCGKSVGNLVANGGGDFHVGLRAKLKSEPAAEDKPIDESLFIIIVVVV